MTCTGYRPVFGAGQLDGTKFAGSNCNCWSAARANDDDTCGGERPTSAEVRYWTGDTSGGTNLAQIDEALNAHTKTRLDVRYRYEWSAFMRRVASGQSAVLQLFYQPIRVSRFSGSETFGGNHSVLVTRGLVVLDPLADGRRPGIYKYHGESYPEALIKSAAGKLNLSGDPDIFRPLGLGFCYAAFTRDNDLPITAHVPPDTDWTHYKVVNGRIAGHTRLHSRSGWTAPCSAPKNVLTQSGNARVSLVQVQKAGSPYNGFWVSSRWSDA